MRLRFPNFGRLIVSCMNLTNFTSVILCLLYAILAVSLPTFNNVDITRINFTSNQTANATGGIDQIRFGIWSFCLYRKALDADPCHSFSPCNLTGEYRLCSSYSYGYDVRIRADDDFDVSALHVNSNWTRAIVCNAAAACFAALNSLLILIRRPSTRMASLAAVTAIFAAIISIAFRFFAGNIDGPGMAISIILAIMSFFHWCLTFFEIDKYRRARERATQSSWYLYPGATIGPVKVVRLNVGEKEVRHPRNNLIPEQNYSMSECAICWETSDELQALPCTHTFCTRCAKPWINSLKRCPACADTTRRKPSDLRRVFCVEDTPMREGLLLWYNYVT